MIQVVSRVVFVSFMVLLKWNICYGQDPCTIPAGYEGVTCACEIPDQGIFDLRPIANSDGTPRFTGITYDSYLYSYNPCYGYNQGPADTACGGQLGEIASCQYTSDFSVTFSLGSSSNEKIYTDGSNTYLEYDGGQDGRITRVYLTCDESATDPVITTNSDNDAQLTYAFYLTTIYACPSADPPSPTLPPGESIAGAIGIVLIVVAFLGLLTYFIVGIIINKFKFQKQGLNMIPQKGFWFDLPFLIKDGFVFTFGPIIRLVRKDKAAEAGYQPLK